MLVIVLVAAVAAWIVVFSSHRIASRPEPVEPVAYALNGDPRSLEVYVRWSADGYCSGQFQPVVDETADRVTVRTVENTVGAKLGPCAGLGTEDGLASGSVTLSAPLGDRPVHRADDNSALPQLRR